MNSSRTPETRFNLDYLETDDVCWVPIRAEYCTKMEGSIQLRKFGIHFHDPA